MKNNGFVKIPRKLLYHTDYLKLSNTAKIFLIYLISLSDRFRSDDFFQYDHEIKSIFDLSRISLWRIAGNLSELGVKMKSTNKRYNFNLEFFFKKFNFDSKMKQQ